MIAQLVRSLLLFLFLVLPLAAPTLAAQEPGGPAPSAPGATTETQARPPLAPIPGPVRDALANRTPRAALPELEQLEREAPDHGDLWAFLRGRALADAGDLQGAVAEWERLEAAFPASAWCLKASFARAELLRELRDFEAAEALYERGVAELRAEGRRRELAAIYLDTADALSTPPETPTAQDPTDYARALQLYSRALELDLPIDLVEHAEFRRALCASQSPDASSAAALWTAYLAHFDGLARPEGLRERRPEALFGQARAFERTAQGEAARRGFEDLAGRLEASFEGEIWPPSSIELGDDDRQRALDALAGEARYAAARLWFEGTSDQRLLAIAALRRFMEQRPTHPRTVTAAYDIARLYRDLGRTEEALAAFEDVLERPLPATDSVEVREEAARLAQQASFDKGQVLYAQGRLEEAIGAFTTYTQLHPNGPAWGNAQRLILEAEYARGTRLEASGDYAGARDAWSRFLERHPLDERAVQIYFDLGRLHRDEGDALRESGGAADAAYAQAITQWTKLVEKYPQTDQASHALYAAARIQETRTDELETAIRTYQRCSFGAYAGEARERLIEMTRETLGVRTERVWRSDETARIAAELRNVETVEVAIYRVDLEAYFRKHLTHRSIEDLDLDLIAPDHSFTYKVEDYRRFAWIEREIELPVEGPGVWAVALSTDERRATTLLVRSDVDVIVKSSRAEVFVYAQDMRANAPAANVSVLVARPPLEADQAPEFHELMTDAGGVARLDLSELRPANEVRVLAVRDGHCASDGLSLDGLQVTSEATPRRLVYTSRPAYKPGDEVRWRAIVRESLTGGALFSTEERYEVIVRDASGRTLHREEAQLGPFGTLHGSLRLDALAPTGAYTVNVRDEEGDTFGTTFRVERYRLETLELTLDFERDVYYRGEEVIAEIAASYYYGAPVSNAPLTYALPDGTSGELMTDADGRAELRFETRQYAGEGPLDVRVHLTQEGVSTTGRAWLAVRAFRTSLEVDRDLFLTGDRVSVRAKTVAPNGEPVGRTLQLQALRRVTSPDGSTSERLVLERELTTDADSGEATASLALSGGGWHTLRIEGTDRFGNPIVSEATVFVSGEEDEVRLRLLSEADVARVGETLVIDLHNRAGAGLALLTVEAERVLDHRIEPLKPGHNRIELAIDPRHYPNVVVTGALMLGNEFHEARADFDVLRELRVRVVPGREEYAPGEEATVTLEVTDALGNPVEAELSLAVVDDALFAPFPDGTADPARVFSAPRRAWPALRTTTSCTFTYAGSTREIAAEVLAEVRRAEADKRWQERRGQALGGLESLREGKADSFFLGLGQFEREVVLLDEDNAWGIEFNDVIGVGGGAGGKFGGRFGGRKKLRAQGGSNADRARSLDADAAYWQASIVTDASGRAEVRFPLPERSTRWRLTTRGIDLGTSAGAATAHFVTREDFFVELDAPVFLTEGDALRVRARVHDAERLAGRAELTLEFVQGHYSVTRTAEVVLGEASVVDVLFDALPELQTAEPVELRLRCEATGASTARSAADSTTVPVRPYGVEIVATASGDLRTSSEARLSLSNAETAGRVLEVHVGPQLSLELVHAALGAGGLPDTLGCRRFEADAASALLGACSVLERMNAEGQRGSPLAGRLREHVRGLTARLVATQREDHGWGWTAGATSSHLPSTCRATWALARARRLGFVPSALVVESARRYLEERYVALSHTDDELKAMVVQALAASGDADFSAANRLHRMRESLSPAALAHTALALVAMDRAPMAREVADVLARRAEEDPEWTVAKNLAWNRAPLEQRALALLALIEAGGDSALVRKLAAELEDAAPWFPARTRGSVIDALARHEGEWTWSDARSRVRVSVNDQPLGVVEVGGLERGELLTLRLPRETPEITRVTFEVEGGAAPRFTARLTGLTREFERTLAGEFRLWRDEGFRTVAPRWRGRVLSTGFSTTQGTPGEEQWTNRVGELPRGARLQASLVYAYDSSVPPDQDPGEYLMLELPLPAGTQLLEGSLSGAPHGFEDLGDRLLVHLGQFRNAGTVSYTLVATDVGAFRTRPAVLRSLYRPERIAIGTSHPLTVLAPGERSSDEYRPTPDELYHLGLAQYEAGEFDEARASLDTLYETWSANLREAPLRETAERLLFLAIRAESAPEIVRFFEVLREKNPELIVPLQDVLAVGRAYRELGEFERALLVFKAVLEQSFGKDLKVAGALEEQGEFLRSVDTLERLWMEYPETPATLAAYLGFAERLLSKAPVAHEDPALRRAGADRAALTVRGILALQRFLSLYANDPLAPQAALGVVSAQLDLENYARVAELSETMAALYEEPRYADAFLYSRAVAQWYLGEDDAAEALLAGIGESTWVDAGGVRRPSENRELALYILAQIFHARRDFDRALASYERVEDDFADAREILEEFRAKRLELAEVTETKVGEATVLELGYAGVESVEVRAYRVDLMTLYLREKNLSQVASVNLAGISPTLETTAPLERALGPEERTTELSLAPLEAGAYLVLCRGGGLHTSGLVLVSDVELRVREDASSGRVRVTALDRESGDYLADVDVRVVGSGSGTFVRGETDRRGLFVADAVAGVTTVIARRGKGEYAFYRGAASLGATQAPGPQERAGLELERSSEYFKNVRGLNRANVVYRSQQLQDEIQRKRDGVKVKSVK